jgi:hypothetical protein
MHAWQSIEAVDKIQTFLRNLYNKTETGFSSLTVDAYGRLTTVNQRLSGLPHLKALTKEANVSITNTLVFRHCSADLCIENQYVDSFFTDLC